MGIFKSYLKLPGLDLGGDQIPTSNEFRNHSIRCIFSVGILLYSIHSFSALSLSKDNCLNVESLFYTPSYTNQTLRLIADLLSISPS